MRGIKGTFKQIGDKCASCGDVLTEENSSKRPYPRTGLYSYCHSCTNARTKQQRLNNPEGYKKKNKNYRSRLRNDVINAYGGKCECCGESTPEFLALDHINGGGNKERKRYANNTSYGVYKMARDLGFPRDRYRLLCHNCNCAIGWYGKCPHDKGK